MGLNADLLDACWRIVRSKPIELGKRYDVHSNRRYRHFVAPGFLLGSLKIPNGSGGGWPRQR